MGLQSGHGSSPQHTAVGHSRCQPAAMHDRFFSRILVSVVFLFLFCNVCPEPLQNICPAVPGPAGLNGRDGRDGKDGAPGSTGIQGPPGDAGTPGLRGSPGPPGKQGPAGNKGETGEQGDKGDTGDAGIQGLRGNPGPPGSKGDGGQKGQKGDPDTSVVTRIASLEGHISILQKQLSTLERELKFPEVMSRAGQKLYATNGKEVDYETSRKACEEAGGSLPMPLTAEENSAIAQIVKTKGKRVYLGINDKEVEGSFKLLTGNRITYANWNAHEPNNSGGAENCAEIIENGKWNDRTCSDMNLNVCEFQNINSI
ncbi:mannose-binding protein C-like [Ambystoma mexicanum]|uniref:mannose-binding protein C-like n=1 Tax=Ambystoma mexicanum TaxID=8296 RepID=UPI0037E8F357